MDMKERTAEFKSFDRESEAHRDPLDERSRFHSPESRKSIKFMDTCVDVNTQDDERHIIGLPESTIASKMKPSDSALSIGIETRPNRFLAHNVMSPAKKSLPGSNYISL